MSKAYDLFHDYEKNSKHSVGLVKKVLFAGLVFLTSVFGCVSVDEKALESYVQRERAVIVKDMKKELEGLFEKSYLPMIKNSLRKEIEESLDKKLRDEYLPLIRQEFSKAIKEQIPFIVDAYAKSYLNQDVVFDKKMLSRRIKNLTTELLSDKTFLENMIDSIINGIKSYSKKGYGKK